MAKPDYHVFICAQQRPPGHPRGSCGERGAASLLPPLSQSLMSRNLLQKVSVVQTACLGPCDMGANMLVYPGGVLYTALKPEDIDNIVESHLVGGTPVADKQAPAELW